MTLSPGCECCPAVGQECAAGYSNAYCDANGLIILTNIPKSCPQRLRQQNTCIATAFNFDPITQQCCPINACDTLFGTTYCTSGSKDAAKTANLACFATAPVAGCVS